MFCQAADHADALQLLQTELGVLARDSSFNLRIVAAAAAHSAASAGLLQCFKDHCLPFLLVNKADKVCCDARVLSSWRLMRAAGRCATCGSAWLACLLCSCAWESRGAASAACSRALRSSGPMQTQKSGCAFASAGPRVMLRRDGWRVYTPRRCYNL